MRTDPDRGPFAGGNTTLHLPRAGTDGGPLRFEAQRTAGVRGYKQNFDLVAEPPVGDWLLCREQMLVTLRPHNPRVQ